MGFVSNLSKDSDLMSAEWIVPKKLYEALDLLRAALPGPSAFLTQRGQNHACAIFVPWATKRLGTLFIICRLLADSVGTPKWPEYRPVKTPFLHAAM